MAHIKLTAEEREEKKENIKRMAKEMGKEMKTKEEMNQERLNELYRDWCKTNRREMDPRDFVLKFGELFKKEVLEVWNEEEWYKLPKDRIGIVKPLKDLIDYFGGPKSQGE